MINIMLNFKLKDDFFQNFKNWSHFLSVEKN